MALRAVKRTEKCNEAHVDLTNRMISYRKSLVAMSAILRLVEHTRRHQRRWVVLPTSTTLLASSLSSVSSRVVSLSFLS